MRRCNILHSQWQNQIWVRWNYVRIWTTTIKASYNQIWYATLLLRSPAIILPLLHRFRRHHTVSQTMALSDVPRSSMTRARSSIHTVRPAQRLAHLSIDQLEQKACSVDETYASSVFNFKFKALLLSELIWWRYVSQELVSCLFNLTIDALFIIDCIDSLLTTQQPAPSFFNPIYDHPSPSLDWMTIEHSHWTVQSLFNLWLNAFTSIYISQWRLSLILTRLSSNSMNSAICVHIVQ